MEFTLICPNDGRVELGLEHVSAIVFRGPESVEVVFECPHCGTAIRAGLHVPNLMLAAMELARYVEEMGGASEAESSGFDRKDIAGLKSQRQDGEPDDRSREERLERERAGEPYCEYFRRQLASIECVEDLLSEIDGR